MNPDDYLSEAGRLETLAFAMHASLFLEFVRVNKDHKELTKEYLVEAIEAISNNTPLIIIEAVADFISSNEGTAWLARMGMGPFSRSNLPDSVKRAEEDE
jgi:hypothetical protein